MSSEQASGEERCVTSQNTPAKEANTYRALLGHWNFEKWA